MVGCCVREFAGRYERESGDISIAVSKLDPCENTGLDTLPAFYALSYFLAQTYFIVVVPTIIVFT